MAKPLGRDCYNHGGNDRDIQVGNVENIVNQAESARQLPRVGTLPVPGPSCDDPDHFQFLAPALPKRSELPVTKLHVRLEKIKQDPAALKALIAQLDEWSAEAVPRESKKVRSVPCAKPSSPQLPFIQDRQIDFEPVDTWLEYMKNVRLLL